MYIIHKPQYPTHFYHTVVLKMYSQKKEYAITRTVIHAHKSTLTYDRHTLTNSITKSITQHHVHHIQAPTPNTFLSQGCPQTVLTKKGPTISKIVIHAHKPTFTYPRYTMTNSITKPNIQHPCTSYTNLKTLHIFITRLSSNCTHKYYKKLAF